MNEEERKWVIMQKNNLRQLLFNDNKQVMMIIKLLVKEEINIWNKWSVW